MSLRWDSCEGLTTAGTNPLHRNELPSLVLELDVLHHPERPVRDRGVVEFVGRKEGIVREPDGRGHLSLHQVIGGVWTETRQAAPLLEPGVFSLGFAEEWEVGVGVLPGGEKVLIGDASLGSVSLLLK